MEKRSLGFEKKRENGIPFLALVRVVVRWGLRAFYCKFNQSFYSFILIVEKKVTFDRWYLFAVVWLVQRVSSKCVEEVDVKKNNNLKLAIVKSAEMKLKQKVKRYFVPTLQNGY